MEPVVKYSFKFVRNLGNFQSAHIEVGIEDSPRGTENVEQAYYRIKEFVESKVVESVKEVNEDLANG